jgi:hypothetical protein
MRGDERLNPRMRRDVMVRAGAEYTNCEKQWVGAVERSEVKRTDV